MFYDQDKTKSDNSAPGTEVSGVLAGSAGGLGEPSGVSVSTGLVAYVQPDHWRKEPSRRGRGSYIISAGGLKKS